MAVAALCRGTWLPPATRGQGAPSRRARARERRHETKLVIPRPVVPRASRRRNLLPARQSRLRILPARRFLRVVPVSQERGDGGLALRALGSGRRDTRLTRLDPCTTVCEMPPPL